MDKETSYIYFLRHLDMLANERMCSLMLRSTRTRQCYSWQQIY